MPDVLRYGAFVVLGLVAVIANLWMGHVWAAVLGYGVR